MAGKNIIHFTLNRKHPYDQIKKGPQIPILNIDKVDIKRCHLRSSTIFFRAWILKKSQHATKRHLQKSPLFNLEQPYINRSHTAYI